MEVQVVSDPYSHTLFVPVSEVFLPEEQPRDHRRSSSDERIPVLSQERPPGVLPGDPECRICEVPLTSSTIQTLPGCDHEFCRQCFLDYLETCITERRTDSLKCPSFGCENLLPDQLLTAVLPAGLQEKLFRYRKENELERNVNFRWCPKPNCTGYDIGEFKRRKLVCSVCEYAFCFYCSEAWHEKGTCRSDGDRKLDTWAKFHDAKFCPNCKLRVQKMKGCNHMTCFKCQYQWCWLCGDHYTPQHYETCPIKRLQKYNPPWKRVFFYLFLPIIAPFFLVIGMWILLEDRLIGVPVQSCCSIFLRKRYISYPLFGGLALILTPLALALLLLFAFVGLLLEFGRYWKYEKNCLGSVARQRCLWVLISLALGMSLSPVAALIVAGALTLAPIAGLYFILQKIVIGLIRCCQPDFMKPTIVPGYAIG